MPRSSRRWLALYVAWIAVCAVLFLALRNSDDPSRRHDRILNDDAGRLALQHLGRVGWRGYDVVHVAWAGKGEGVATARWIVLCDRRPRTGLAQAIVVEVDGVSGAILGVRPPRGSGAPSSLPPQLPNG